MYDKLCYSPQEAAELLGISKGFINRFIKMGELRSFMLGNRRLINKEAIDDFRTRLEGGGIKLQPMYPSDTHKS